jgi:GH35 family endo-1,4-beta-xylanase
MHAAPLGEEWKLMDATGRRYDPAHFTADLDRARSDIRRLRCQDADLRLVDPAGRPVAGLRVELAQTRSAFHWGEQLWELDTLFRHDLRESDRVHHYTRRFTDCLNSANCLSYWTEAPRNDGPKHMEFQGLDQLDGFERQVDWALKNGLTPKGHPIFWSIAKAYPEWLKRYPLETQWKFIEVRVRNLVARFKGKVKLWDVVNEPMWEAAPKHLPQRHWPHLESLEDIAEYVVPVLRWAREEDPAAKFIVNDYGMELDPADWVIRDKNGEAVTAAGQRRRFVALFRRLRELGACPDGLGMQAHTGVWMNPSEQRGVLDEFAEAGVPLHYTEFWAEEKPLVKAGIAREVIDRMKAEYIANIMTVAFAHPSVDSFYFWGDLNQSMGFRNDHNSLGLPSSSHVPTVVYERVRRLLRDEWMTRETLTSDADGRVRFRGFLGDYELRYRQAADMPAASTFSLSADTPGERRLVLHRPA